MENIYLDHAASMPIDPRVSQFAEHYLTNDHGNPSSLYTKGLQAKEAVEEARHNIASLINAENDQSIIFTGSNTEANNLALIGTARRNQNIGTHLCASAIEHISVINPMKYLQKEQFSFNTIPVDATGVIILKELKEKVTKKTIITSVMYANNEIGTIQPIKEVSDIVHRQGNYLHVDATAAAGRIPIDVQKENIDLLTLSSNDLYGPPGAGALYKKPGVKLQTILFGGGQEQGLRSGTENIFAIAGMGEAARIIKKEMNKESTRLKTIRDQLIKQINQIPESYLTGHPTKRLPHHASFRFDGIEGESILLNMDMYGIQIATGSACSSKTLEPSRVLIAIGLKHEQAHGSMVMTLGRSNTKKQIPSIVNAVQETVKRLRMLSPLSKT